MAKPSPKDARAAAQRYFAQPNFKTAAGVIDEERLARERNAARLREIRLAQEKAGFAEVDNKVGREEVKNEERTEMDVSTAPKAAVLKEIRLIIVEALRNGDAIRPNALAMIVARNYPKSGLTEEIIAEAIRQSAAVAGVKVLRNQFQALEKPLRRFSE